MAHEWITLVHRVPEARSDSYACTACRGSWYAQEKTAVASTGLQSARMVRCRIPADTLDEDAAEALAALVPGDRIVRGAVSVTDGAEFAALGRSRDAATVLDVHDNRRGVFPHYYIEGAG